MSELPQAFLQCRFLFQIQGRWHAPDFTQNFLGVLRRSEFSLKSRRIRLRTAGYQKDGAVCMLEVEPHSLVDILENADDPYDRSWVNAFAESLVVEAYV